MPENCLPRECSMKRVSFVSLNFVWMFEIHLKHSVISVTSCHWGMTEEALFTDPGTFFQVLFIWRFYCVHWLPSSLCKQTVPYLGKKKVKVEPWNNLVVFKDFLPKLKLGCGQCIWIHWCLSKIESIRNPGTHPSVPEIRSSEMSSGPAGTPKQKQAEFSSWLTMFAQIFYAVAPN